MFSCLLNFLYRHRRKFYVSGIAVGSVAVMSKIVQQKLIAWQDQHAQQLLEQQKRKQHYERTLETTRIALLQLIPNIRKVLERELDSDTFLQAIKEQPHRKLQLWDQLKVICFGRAVCTVVCGALGAAVSHVMTMILAANTLDNHLPNTDEEKQNVLSVEVQAMYLSCLQNLIEEQLPSIVSRTMDIATNSLSSLPLTRKLTMPQLESIMQQITFSVTNNKNVDGTGAISAPSVLPWSQYLQKPEGTLTQPEYSEQLHNMYLLTIDILNTDDFNEVVNTLVQVGLDYVLDDMAAYYFNNQVNYKTEQQRTVESDTIEERTNNNASAVGVYCNEIASCQVVKLVPLLNGTLHRALPTVRSSAPSDATYYNRLVSCLQLEVLAYNVYDTLVLSVGDAHQ